MALTTKRRARAALFVSVFALSLTGASIGWATTEPVSPTSEPSQVATSPATAGPSATASTTEEGLSPAGSGGGTISNGVAVVNTTDGRFANRAGFGIARVTGGDV